MRFLSRAILQWKYLTNFTKFSLSLVEAYFLHFSDDLKWQYFIFKLRFKKLLIQTILLETNFRHLCLFISINFIFYYLYAQRFKVSEIPIPLFYLIISFVPIYIHNMWKKSVSQKVRERIAYSGIEDSDGWVIIDKVELVNEPNDRVWRVLSTCGNLAKFILVLRRKSYSKYTFVVVPSCIASAMLGRYVPGVVLLHIASMSFITWPYLTFFPFLFFNVGKYGCNKAARYLCVKIPKCYRTFRKMISSNDKREGGAHLTTSDSTPATGYNNNNNKGIMASFLLPAAWFRSQVGGVTRIQPGHHQQEGLDPGGGDTEAVNAIGGGEVGDDEDYEEFHDYIPLYDERTAFLLEEAAEALSTSPDDDDDYDHYGDSADDDQNIDDLAGPKLTIPLNRGGTVVGSPVSVGRKATLASAASLAHTDSVESVGTASSNDSSDSSYIRQMLDGASLADFEYEPERVGIVLDRERSLKDLKLKKRHNQARQREKDSPFSDMVAEGLKNVYQSLAQNFATWATDAQAAAVTGLPPGSSPSATHHQLDETDPDEVEFYIQDNSAEDTTMTEKYQLATTTS